jgi:aminoglycoside/choline kinase family phosphotransferase/dTDP-glucose pyrophosphorylase
MKAMILAAGFGTRLRPHSELTPKPLFPIEGQPLLDRIIGQLKRAGCSAVIVNTHHLHEQIAAYLKRRRYGISVFTRFEPVILGTGGGIKNVADFWDDQPFIVINADVVTDIDLADVYACHRRSGHPATLVMHNFARFNTVWVDADGFVTAFGGNDDHPAPDARSRRLAFTGIQVLDPQVLDYIPAGRFYSSIDAYRQMIAAGRRIHTYIARGHRWSDIGTPDSYRRTAYAHLAPLAFQAAHPSSHGQGEILRHRLPGDGSDRRWYRLTRGSASLIMADHGIRPAPPPQEADAFVAIGRHLHGTGVAVPQIHLWDTFAGLVFMEDLGNENLQQTMTGGGHSRLNAYRAVIRQVIAMSVDGARGFDPAWTYQTPTYSRELILEKECGYFLEAYVRGYLDREVDAADYSAEFARLADDALAHADMGFMHRDLQSRNIMVKNGRYYFIDFQGGRLGPLQYDLASLLIDPYVDLPEALRRGLLDDALAELRQRRRVDPARFRRGFDACALCRNLQILGAFGFLSRVKQKQRFERYIPAAVRTLTTALARYGRAELPRLNRLVETIVKDAA